MIRRIISALIKRARDFYPNLNKKLKASNWYHNIFPHLYEYERLQRGADIVCIGSTPAKNAIDFNVSNKIKGYNLAVCPETIYYDFQVLKNYHSYLKPGGTILFVLCPFTFLKDFYRNEFGSTSYLNIRYYPILHRAMIDTYDSKLYRKYVEEPLLINKKAIFRLFYDSQKQNSFQVYRNPLTPEESRIACQLRLKRWMREFGMTDLIPENIPQKTQDVICGNVKIFKEIKDFIEERGYKAYIIVPPFPDEMTSLLPTDLVEFNLFKPIKSIGLPFINYYGKKEWLNRELYYHGFLLNAKGRELFTKDVLSKILQ